MRMARQVSDSEMVDIAMVDAPVMHGRQLDRNEVEEIFKLLEATVRAPHRCISKGQYHQACCELLAQNYILTKRIKELQDDKANAGK